jgi:hypothetical protein
MLNRQVTAAVAAMCCGVPPAKLRKLMKKAGMKVGFDRAVLTFDDPIFEQAENLLLPMAV